MFCKIGINLWSTHENHYVYYIHLKKCIVIGKRNSWCILREKGWVRELMAKKPTKTKQVWDSCTFKMKLWGLETVHFIHCFLCIYRRFYTIRTYWTFLWHPVEFTIPCLNNFHLKCFVEGREKFMIIVRSG